MWWGRYALEGPEFHLRMDDGTRKTVYDVFGVARTPDEARELRAIGDVAIFLRGLVPSKDAFDPGPWLFPRIERESLVCCYAIPSGLANDAVGGANHGNGRKR